MFKSTQCKFIFTHIPKTGGTSIKHALLPYADKGQLSFDGEKVTDAPGWKPHKPLTGQQAMAYAPYYKFTVVRNPWARLASLYLFLKDRDREIVRGKHFGQFILEVCSRHNAYKKSQTEYGLAHMNQILAFERLEENFGHLIRNLNQREIHDPIPEDLSLGHFKNQGEYDYRNMYTPTTRELVATHSRSLIRLFRYQF